MEGKKLIHSIRLKNFLSYGDKSEEIKLEPLNVLIGRNASGKSNLIEAISLLQAAPNDLLFPIRNGGGTNEWLNKGNQPQKNKVTIASIETVVFPPKEKTPLRYQLGFTTSGQQLEIAKEIIEKFDSKSNKDNLSFYSNFNGKVTLGFKKQNKNQNLVIERLVDRNLSRDEINHEQSVLSWVKDSFSHPEITNLGKALNNIRIFRNLSLDRNSSAKFPQKADLPDDFLQEDGSNLGLVLDDLIDQNGAIDKIVVELKKFYEEADIIRPKIRGNTVQLFIHEKGLTQPIPATRLSDGTLRYLCLLTILCHPEPPPLICIEEPELGLHPDILPTIADLLIEASQRTQLIVTTHSDALVSALSGVPEAVLVCERDDDGTHLQRLEPSRLKEWLEKYSLGELWRMGEIGGNRW